MAQIKTDPKNYRKAPPHTPPYQLEKHRAADPRGTLAKNERMIHAETL